MDEGSYQLITMGAIVVSGLAVSTYLSHRRKPMTNYFVNKFKKQIGRINKINKGLENLV